MNRASAMPDGELRRVLGAAITARDIAEPLTSFGASRGASVVRRWMEAKDFDVAGVLAPRSGRCLGWIRREDLREGRVADHARPFRSATCLDARAPLSSLVRALRTRPRVFLELPNGAHAIVTRADIQKAPFRMWLFGLVSLLEMEMLRRIRARHPDDAWRALLTPERVAKAEAVLAARRARNEASDLAECLQFGDKAAIVRKSRDIRAAFGFPSVKALKRFLESAEALRDQLAHSSDLTLGAWDATSAVMLDLERVLSRLGEAPCPPT